MKLVVAGASGFLGAELVSRLRERGDEVLRLVRRPPTAPDEAQWDPAAGEIDSAVLVGAHAVVSLGGVGIGDRRWTESHRRAVLESRVQVTGTLAGAIAGLEAPPQVFVSASAIGFYGDRGDEELVEESSAGQGFLPDVCREWEDAAEPARAAGIRVVHLRIGVVLDANGGALDKMLPPFKLGVGGILGNGRQYMSWVSLDDLCGIIEHVIDDPDIVGPVNAVAPQSVTNHEFTKTLGRVLVRPTIFPVPGIGARVAFGEMAGPLLLASTRVAPLKLQESGYRFEHAKLEDALRAVLGR